jgi:hypothetical protein
MTQDIRTIRIATQGPAGPAGPAGPTGAAGGGGEVFAAASQAEMLALAALKGDIAIRSDVSKSFVLTASPPATLANWSELLTPPAPVQSVASHTGAVTLSSGDVSGLGYFATGADASNLTGTLNSARLSAIPNSALANAGVTISGHALALGGTLAPAQADIAGLTTADAPAFANLALATGTIATSQPAVLTQTWNAGGVAFTALKVNVTSTASASGSLLADLQVGGATKLSVDKSGSVVSASGVFNGATVDGPGNITLTGANSQIKTGSGNLTLSSGSGGYQFAVRTGGFYGASSQQFGFTDGTSYSGTADTTMSRAAAGVIACNGTLQMTSIPTADPHVAGRLWSNSGVVTVSAG